MATSAITYGQGQSYDSSIPKYPAPCPVAPYRRSNSATLTGYRSIYRTRSGFGEEEDERTEPPAVGDPDGTHWHPDQRFAPSAPYRPFEEDSRTDEYYRRYLQLSGNIAFKHPNPGYPRERQGAIGGSWRHIKEVLGYQGGQVCFVDGLVRLYDTDTKHHSMNQSRGMRAALATPAYAANRHNVNAYSQEIQRGQEQRAYKPWDDSKMPAIKETPRQQMTSGSSKYKGFYSYRQ